MSLSKQEIEKIAQLARISLDDAEKERLMSDLSAVIDYFQKLQSLDTSSVNLDLAETENMNRTRPDVAADSGVQEQILSQAPMREDAFFKVKSVL